ncbi:3',5'-bisphosphate nucleotidase/inositol-1,4- bisphosphate 1-phosphatase [Schizosaccharomyces japonicus yFS275]|uniref:3'(2'),5'-bisphosphate nucleotidase n=1 Tax=Schizosaccharomyces japonicus (strain yFS275 / FY16936) TaxID=402676 RepID=B6JYN5_SCHJY|nr:3',5'-bisphosphate nucleotidase/inositol-1,4- bisphosphate 1-phosphatase [Schizosaccharomyces japonicus yFS275]EEB06653.1 3',5'-bisphosphate nucleotidase/inositol-1,4- bisphosphate 1-phosphatase [Schizosaccharomyces japonicus yFS275]
MSFQKELEVAISAVRRASFLTEKVFNELVQLRQKHQSGAIIKSDQSPVTVGDFGAQAVIAALLHDAFPQDPIVGEESADFLRSNDEVCNQVWSLVQESTKRASEFPELGRIASKEDMCNAIDRGSYVGGPTGRMWSIDPIDGTKGFLRGDQYAICLSLIQDGVPVVGAIGCPNLYWDVPATADGRRGLVMAAVRSRGCYQYELHKDGYEGERVQMRPVTRSSDAKFCEGVEPGHSMQDTQEQIARELGITLEATRMDSQAKYASLARGDGDIYLRLPRSMKFEEKIWDHAGGSLLVQEAGGIVGDMFGKPLDFGRGRTLNHNHGVIAAAKGIYEQVIAATKKVTGNDPQFAL